MIPLETVLPWYGISKKCRRPTQARRSARSSFGTWTTAWDLVKTVADERWKESGMPNSGGYMFFVSMDVAPEKEALFNEVYDSEHVPYLLQVPGVRSVTRLCLEPAAFNIGGETKPLTGDGAPRYMAIYELDSPDVLISAAWAEAGEKGRWATEVRPHTTNRHHVVRKVL